VRTLVHLSRVYAPGDTDLAWASVTQWRAVLSTIIEQFREAPASVLVTGNATHPSSFLVAAWLGRALHVPTRRETEREAITITGVHFTFEDGTDVALSRSAGSSVAHMTRSGLEPAEVNLARRSVQDCLMEELRRLDPDEFYGRLLQEDIPSLGRQSGFCGPSETDVPGGPVEVAGEGGAA
jgi:glucose-6-phosphate dehydrogenase assembly protein OpcA